MTRLRIFFSRLSDLLLRRSREDRIDSEIDHHIQMLADEMESGGMSRGEALLAARKQFGGVDRVRMVHREQRGLPMIDMLVQDVRFALRVLMRDRGFAFTAVLVLGLGLGVNNLFFTLVYAHNFRGVLIDDVERVLFVSTFDDRISDRALSLTEYDDLRRSQAGFSAMGAYAIGDVTIGDQGRAPDRFDVAYVTASVFPLLRVSPLMGRLPAEEHDRLGAEPVVMLGTDVWRSRYAQDPQILGRSILVNGSAATVIGIVPERSGFPTTASVWLPLGQWPDWKPDRTPRSLRVIGRLRDGVTEASARSEVETIFGRLETAHPDTNRNVRARVVTLNERLLGNLNGWMPFISAGIIVILIACANLANLMIARALQRAPEIAIRTSLGANRTRIVCQLLVEAVAIAVAGAVLGAGVSIVGVAAVEAGIPAGTLPYWTDYTMDRGAFTALVMVSLATVVIFGLVPALYASHTDVNRTLKDGGRSSTSAPAMRWWTSTFLTVQLALAMILLVQVAVATYLSNQSIPTDANINTTDVITAAITLPTTSYPTADRRADFFTRLDERLKGRSEFVATSRATVLPGSGNPQRRLLIRGRELPPGTNLPTVLAIDVAPGYLDTIALGIVRGRDFMAVDGTPGRGVAIVNERFSQVFLDGADPLASEIAVAPFNAPAGAEPQWVTIVGIAPAIRQQGAGGVDQQSPVVYLPIAASAPVSSALIVRHRVDPETAASVLRAEAQGVDPNVALYRMRTLAQAVSDGQWNRHTSAVLAETVTSLSVLLAIVGLYAVTSQRVTLKTREIGLRMALGARRFQIAKLVVGGLRAPLFFGLLLGTAGAMAWDGAYSTGLAGVYASAPPTLLKSAAFITVLVLVSCFIPVRRATATNPTSALRHD